MVMNLRPSHLYFGLTEASQSPRPNITVLEIIKKWLLASNCNRHPPTTAMPPPISVFSPQDFSSSGLLRRILLDLLDQLENKIHTHNMTKRCVANFRRKNEGLQSIVWQAEQTVMLLR